MVCLLVGVAGAVKIHTKHLLFRWAPPEFRKSTPLAAKPVQAICVQAITQGGQLQEVDPEQLDDYDYIFCKLVPHGIFTTNSLQSGHVAYTYMLIFLHNGKQTISSHSFVRYMLTT